MASQPHSASIKPTFDFLDSLQDAHRHTLALIADLDDEQLMGPRLQTVNPLLWEIGHVAWFQEYWVLRHLNGRAPILPHGDTLYDSANVAHDTRWDLPLPSRAQTLGYLQEVLDRIMDRYLEQELDTRAEYFLSLALFHEDMHDEAFGYTRQTLGYPKPELGVPGVPPVNHAPDARATLGDAQIPGGQLLLGSVPDRPFIFDNEMDAHEVQIEPFAISRTAVRNADF